MNRIKAFSICTDNMKCLRDNFLKTFQEEWDLRISYFKNSAEENGDFGTPGYLKIVRKKIELLAENVRKHPNEILVWTDMDIQFFGKCTPLLLRALKNKDIVTLSEYWPEKKINSGFMAMRCNPAMTALFDFVKASNFEMLPFFDQTAIEEFLYKEKKRIRWDVLPWQFWAPSHGWPPPIDSVLHHAICTQPVFRNGQKTESVALKMEQLECVKKQMEKYSELPWFLSLGHRVHSFISHHGWAAFINGKALLK